MQLTIDVLKNHIDKLKKASRIKWQGLSRTGKWVNTKHKKRLLKGSRFSLGFCPDYLLNT